MNSFKGKRIVVFGASSGIGKSVVANLIEKGTNVIAVARNKERLDEIKSQLSNELIETISFDISKQGEIEAFVEKVGPVDGILHSAGGLKMYPLRSINQNYINEMFVTHLFSPILITSIFAKNEYLNPGSSSVFVSSIAALSPYKGGSIYSMAKAGLLTAVKSMTIELGIANKSRFNCVVPGLVETELTEKTKLAGQDRYKDLVEAIPFGIGKPNDVAGLITFLLSNESSWISGSSFVVDGGYLSQL